MTKKSICAEKTKTKQLKMSKYSLLVWTLFVLLVVCLPTRDAWLFGGGGGDAEEPAEAEEPAGADDEDLPLKTTHPSKDL